MSNWAEPSRQDWVSDAPDSRIYGSRKVMEARIESAFGILARVIEEHDPKFLGVQSRYLGTAIAHWGLALMELDEREAVR